jgi:hypothetical protein
MEEQMPKVPWTVPDEQPVSNEPVDLKSAHYRAAEKLLRKVGPSDRDIAKAQVHALLALVDVLA